MVVQADRRTSACPMVAMGAWRVSQSQPPTLTVEGVHAPTKQLSVNYDAIGRALVTA